MCAPFLSAVMFETFVIPMVVQRVDTRKRVVLPVKCTIFQPVSTNISERPSVRRSVSLVDVTARTRFRKGLQVAHCAAVQ